MVKDIKTIECPKCGSINKQEIKPDFYTCQNCGASYFLNRDDQHIYHHHEQKPLFQSSAPVGNQRLPIYLLVGAAFLFAVLFGITKLRSNSTKSSTYTASSYKMPRSYYQTFLYANSATGDPIYLRLGTDQIDKGNNKYEQELHAQFNNATNGDLIADRLITDNLLKTQRCSITFREFEPHVIYGIACNNTLVQLDTKNNRLENITTEEFKSFPMLSSGLARLDFDYQKPIINIMNNEGDSYYYFPNSKKLVATQAEADAQWRSETKDKRYFEFGYLGGDFDTDKKSQLIEVNYNSTSGEKDQRDFTPARKYFSPGILYQDKNHLLIAVNTTAAADPAVSIQSIDINTGKIKWTLPPDRYDLSNTTKCKQGFAIEYRKGEEADYVHGVMVFSEEGKLINNYQLSRTE